MAKITYIFLLLMAITSTFVVAQPQQTTMYCKGGLFSNGYLGMNYLTLPNGTGNDYVWVSPAQSSNGNGNYNLTFCASKSSTTSGTYWGANNATLDVNSSVNFLVNSADAHWITVVNKKYVFTVADVATGTAKTEAYIFELGGTPAVISTTGNSFAFENTGITITATLGSALVSNQVVYLRWSTSSNFANSTVTEMTGSNVTYTADIPAQIGGTTIYYYCFSSGTSGLTAGNCNTATINATQSVNFTVAGNSPVLLTSQKTISGFTYPYKYGPSNVQSFTLSGALLTGFPDVIKVTASANYEVSLDSTTFSGSSVTVPFTSASFGGVKVYVRLKAGLSKADYNGEEIVCTGGGAAALRVACNGSVTSSDPMLTVAPGTLNWFSYSEGSGPSASKTYLLTGKFLTGYPGNITVNASQNFEVSADNVTFSSTSVSIPYASAALSVPVYVRLKAGLSSATYDTEYVSNAGGGAAIVKVGCTGIVSPTGVTNQTYWWNDQVFYELFVRSFYDGSGDGIGDFAGLTKKLDYLNDGNPATTTDLGVTTLWLMPIMESPSYHGYDVVDYKKVEKDFGTNAQFKAFLDSAHVRGIKVILDLVLNHTSSQHPWFINSCTGTSSPYRDWYVWKTTNPGGTGPWGEQIWYGYGGSYYYGVFTSSMPDLNYFNTNVKDTINGIIKYWLDTVKVDGFRLDGARYVCEEGSVLADAPSNLAFWRDFRKTIKGINPNAFSVGEVWTSTTNVIPYSDGTGLDICFEFETASDIISSINAQSPTTLKNQIDNVVVKKFPFLQYGTFLTNHDNVRVCSQLNDNMNYTKLAASLLLTLPGVPFMYYGEELGMTSGSDDPSKRTPMQWTNGTNAGFTTGSPWKSVTSNYTTRNVQTMSADSTSILNLYKKLINLRQQYPALRRGEYIQLTSSNSGMYAFGRNYVLGNSVDLLFPLHNFTSSTITNPTLTFAGTDNGCKPGTYALRDVATNASAGQFVIKADGSMTFTPSVSVSAYGTKILKADLITGISSPEDAGTVHTFNLEQNYPNPFNPSTMISFALPHDSHVRLTVYNALGQIVRVLVDQYENAGNYRLTFDGSGLSSGLYFYRLDAGSYSQTKKMMLLK